MPDFLSRFLSTSARAILPPDDIPIAEWVEKNRRLPRGSAYEGPKRVALTSALRIIYEWFRDPFIREIVVIKSAQIGYTDLLVDLILWIACNDPAPTVLYFADQSTAKKMMAHRIKPPLVSLGLVRQKADNKTQEVTSYECHLANGFNLVVSWASSIAATAALSYKYIFCDEIDKPGYQATGTEGGALGRIRERAETYPDRKIILGSTPTLESGLIFKEIGRVNAMFDYCVPCPSCGMFQPLRWVGVIWEGGSKATSKQASEARYKCSGCGFLWTDQQKSEAISHGKGMPRDEIPGRLVRVGLQLNRIGSLFPGGRLESLVNDWVSKQGDPVELQNFVNSTLGEPWKQVVKIPAAADVLTARLEAQHQYMVPTQAVCVIMSVDTQQNGFWWRLRAWARDGTSWGMAYGFAVDWDDLDALIFRRGYEQDGHYLPVWRVGIDSGGTTAKGIAISRTEEVYEWFRRHRGRGARVFVCKGSSRDIGTDLSMGKPLEKMPSTNKALPPGHGLQIIELNTSRLKERFFYKLGQAQRSEEMGAYLEATCDERYANQITAEEKRIGKNGVIEWHQIRPDNHMLDCEMMQMAMASSELFGGVAVLRPPPLPTPETPKAPARSDAHPDSGNPWTRNLVGGGR